MLSEFGIIVVLGIAYFLGYYFDATQNQRALRNRPLNLKQLEDQHTWRILPMHLGIMLRMLAIGDDDPGPAPPDFGGYCSAGASFSATQPRTAPPARK